MKQFKVEQEVSDNGKEFGTYAWYGTEIVWSKHRPLNATVEDLQGDLRIAEMKVEEIKQALERVEQVKQIRKLRRTLNENYTEMHIKK